ncbi:hypothetical protein F5141DRAFT_1149883 [Pisolithus sp. B1]|nr:hypothetical protein F5141DRAFT_1149883 [Pisolithus sp. B1]
MYTHPSSPVRHSLYRAWHNVRTNPKPWMELSPLGTIAMLGCTSGVGVSGMMMFVTRHCRVPLRTWDTPEVDRREKCRTLADDADEQISRGNNAGFVVPCQRSRLGLTDAKWQGNLEESFLSCMGHLTTVYVHGVVCSSVYGSKSSPQSSRRCSEPSNHQKKTDYTLQSGYKPIRGIDKVTLHTYSSVQEDGGCPRLYLPVLPLWTAG